jgi:glutathione S-transferase
MSTGAADMATFALRQSPSSTRFVTNKMCPFAQKAWIALEVCKAPYEMEEVSLYGSNGKPAWFMELNPDGTVPVLECYGGAIILPDSDLILDHVADGSVEGGTVLKAQDEQTSQLVEEWREDISKMLPIGKSVVQGDRSSKKKLDEILERMDGKVVGPFLCGEKITLADCAAFPFLWRLDNEFGLESCPNIRAWLDACGETEAFAKTVQSSWWWWW